MIYDQIQIRKTAARPAPGEKGLNRIPTSDLSCLRPTIQHGIPFRLKSITRFSNFGNRNTEGCSAIVTPAKAGV